MSDSSQALRLALNFIGLGNLPAVQSRQRCGLGGKCRVKSPVLYNEVKNDVGDENGTSDPQYLRTEYNGVMVCGPRRLDYALPIIFRHAAPRALSLPLSANKCIGV
jgi:hypothetical protein